MRSRAGCGVRVVAERKEGGIRAGSYVRDIFIFEPRFSKVSIFSFWLGNSCLTITGHTEPSVPDFDVRKLEG